LRQFLLGFAKYWLLPILVNVAAFGWMLGMYYNVPYLTPAVREARCAFSRGPGEAVFGHEKFISQSAFDQALTLGENAAEEDAEVAGWRIYRPADPEKPARIRLTLTGPEEAAVFFPRLEGEGASIAVNAIKDGKASPVFLLTGKKGVWTPISAQYPLNLACYRHDGRAELEIVLTGRWTQLWHKDNQIFF